MLRGDRPGPGESDPPEVLDLMQRVTLIPTVRPHAVRAAHHRVHEGRPKLHASEGTGREFIWDFEEAGAAHPPIAPGLAIGSEAHYDKLIDTCRRLDGIDGAAHRLVALTIPH